MLELDLLKNFVIVARSGSISMAAAQIGRTQSALSMQMQRLEVQVGQPLLQRTGAGVRLTGVGERLVVHAETLLARHDDILADIAGTALKGNITLGCPEDYSIAFIPKLLTGFCAANPQVEIRLVCAPTIGLRTLLLRRQIDMALLSLSDPNHADVIRQERLVWVTGRPNPQLLESEVLPLALSAPATLDHRAACDAMEMVNRRYRIAFASGSLAGLIAITRAGHAVSVLTRTAVPPDLHIVAKGLPHLPTIGIALEFAESRPSSASAMLGAHIRAVLPTIGEMGSGERL